MPIFTQQKTPDPAGKADLDTGRSAEQPHAPKHETSRQIEALRELRDARLVDPSAPLQKAVPANRTSPQAGRDVNIEVQQDREFATLKKEGDKEEERRYRAGLALMGRIRTAIRQAPADQNVVDLAKKLNDNSAQAASPSTLVSLFRKIATERRQASAELIISSGYTRDQKEVEAKANQLVDDDIIEKVAAELGADSSDPRIARLKEIARLARASSVGADGPQLSAAAPRADVVASIAAAHAARPAKERFAKRGCLALNEQNVEFKNNRGIPENAAKSLDAVFRDNDALIRQLERVKPDARGALKHLYETVRADRYDPERGVGLDRGAELERLIPLLVESPQSLTRLDAVATATNLFGIKQDAGNPEPFEKLRREFLVELVRGTIDPLTLTQGPGSHCAQSTRHAQLAEVDPAEYVRRNCSIACTGRVMGRGNLEAVIPPGAHQVALAATEGSLGHIRSWRRSYGMTICLETDRQLPKSNQADHEGAYADEYTQTDRAITGYEVICAGNNAKIYLDRKSGDVFHEPAPGRELITREEYLEGCAKAGKPVLVDTLWSHAAPGERSDSRHARHRLRVLGEDGTHYLVQNPIGGILRFGSDSKYVAEGTILGDSNFSFKTDKASLIYIRKDVLHANLRTVSIEQEKVAIDASKTDAPLCIGDHSGRGTPDYYIRGGEYEQKDDDRRKRRAEDLDEEGKVAVVVTDDSRDRSSAEDEDRSRAASRRSRRRGAGGKYDDEILESVSAVDDGVWDGTGWSTPEKREERRAPRGLAASHSAISDPDPVLVAPPKAVPADLAQLERRVDPDSHLVRPEVSQFTIPARSQSADFTTRALDFGHLGQKGAATSDVAASFRPKDQKPS